MSDGITIKQNIENEKKQANILPLLEYLLLPSFLQGVDCGRWQNASHKVHSQDHCL